MIEQGGKVATGFIDALKREPLSLALCAMNVALLLFCWVVLKTVAAQRKEEVGLLYQDKKEVREMLARCIVPDPNRRSDLEQPSLLSQHPLGGSSQ
jgi:hypothetical protein